MIDTPDHLAGRLREEGSKVREFFLGLPPQMWDMQVYSDGTQWTVRQVLAHIASAENSMGRLVKNILAGGAGSPADFDIDTYNERKVLEQKNQPVAELIRLFAESREANSLLTANLTPADLARVGRHPFLGIVPLSEIIKMIYRHDQIHLRDLRKLLT